MIPSEATHGSRSDTVVFVKAAIASLDSMSKAGVPYGKASVMLFDFRERGNMQGGLLLMPNKAHDARREALISSLDTANYSYGLGTVKFGIEKFGRGVWALKQDHKSPAHATERDELAVVKC